MGNEKGDISERPAHTVRIAKPIAIGKYEVTVAEWNTCAAAGGCSYKPRMKDATDRTPVHRLSWKDIQEYLAWLKQTTGKTYRLPSEAEWEYAARGGTSGRFWWGDRMTVGMADCKECGSDWSYARPAPVDASKPNPFGLYGMSGGVWEWTDDCWRSDYDGAPTDGSASSKGNCSVRVLRGGSWRNDYRYAHVSSRLRYDYNVRYSTNGFRVVRDLP
jgi:formylglycine-generating enzyme required for sulfatase activity